MPQLKRVHINSFPAVHLKSMDLWDSSLKFSSELLVLSLTAAVALSNIYYFSAKGPGNYHDRSFAASFLRIHPEWNRKLADRNGSIITTVSQGGLIAQAQADSFVGLEPFRAEGSVLSALDGGETVSESGLALPNPDSVQGLIAKQIKIYESQPGDTLKSVATANRISVNTIKWANGLNSNDLKPGWQLVILPTDGVLHRADANDTLPDLAKKYAVNLDAIISYNLLDNAEDIEPGQLIIVPGGIMPVPPAARPTPPTPPSSGGQETKPKGKINNGTGHIFPWGYCTWYVASKIHVPWGGNAKNWLANARAYGAIISKEAAVGSIVVTTDNSRYGHVAVVEQVTEDRIQISEMNYVKFGKVNQRWISKNSPTIRGYIYP